MPDLKATVEDAIERLDAEHGRQLGELNRRAVEIEKELREVADTLPAIPERAADFMERAAIAASASFEVPHPFNPPDEPHMIRAASVNLETLDRGGFRLVMLESRGGVPLPVGRYRVLLFVLPVAP